MTQLKPTLNNKTSQREMESLLLPARSSEEPGSGKPHAGICKGAAGQPAVLP